MEINRISLCVLSCLGAIAGSGAPAAAQLNGGVLDIGPAPQVGSIAWDISDDGRVVVGELLAVTVITPIRWTAREGATSLDGLPVTGSNGARAVSADGSTIVGGSSPSLVGYRWRAGQPVDILPGPAFCVSADGEVAAGVYRPFQGANTPYRWTAEGVENLGAVLGVPGYVRGLSADGDVLISDTLVYRSSTGAVISLGSLGGGTTQARGISADGSVVVGASTTSSGALHAFRWTLAGGMQDLGVLPGDDGSYAHAVSANGDVVVGTLGISSPHRAFRWTASTGLQILDSLGQPSEALGVSADGTLVMGHHRVLGKSVAFLWGADCDADSAVDAVEIQLDPALDCNGNARIDSCDIGSGSSPDLNLNGRPDECDCLGGAAPSTYCTAKLNSSLCLPTIAISSSPSVSGATQCLITATNIQNNRSGVLFYGYQAAIQPFQGGFLCVQTPLRRTPLQSAGVGLPNDVCGGRFSFDFNALIASGIDPALQLVGQTFAAQYWARDGQDPFGSSLTDAVQGQVCN